MYKHTERRKKRSLVFFSFSFFFFFEQRITVLYCIIISETITIIIF